MMLMRSFLLVGAKSPIEFISNVLKPQNLIHLVMAGKPIDDTMAQLSEFIEEGDIIVHGGNECYINSSQRAKKLGSKGINFLRMSISGGEGDDEIDPFLWYVCS